MTREAFIDKYLDEMVGLLLSAFAAERKGAKDDDKPVWNDAERGRFMIQQMRRSRNLLGRLYDDLNVKEKK
jgi:hypothetical protein